MGMAAPSPKGSGPKPGINITPLVDVALVVLIIFMVVAPMLTKTFTLSLPPESSEAPPKQKQEPLVMTIDQNGAIRLGSRSVAREELSEVLPQILAATGVKVLNVAADDRVAYGEVIEILDLSRAAGAKSIAVITKKLDKP
jgi:biopolymer transport protein ExbD